MIARLITPLLIMVLLLVSHGVYASEIQLPRTGQTNCYDVANAVIPCAGTGQDGDKLAGKPWPNPRFTDNGNGTVSDNLTGLVWLKDPNCTDSSGGISKDLITGPSGWLYWMDALAWSNNLGSGTCGLSDGSVAGDWRLPNINELSSLVDTQKSDSVSALPAGQPFGSLWFQLYWSSSTYALSSSKDDAWIMDMPNGGRIGNWGKDGSVARGLVWPVRDGATATVKLPRTGQTGCWNASGVTVPCSGTGQNGDKLSGIALPVPRFIVNNNGTVTDNLTGLIWLQNAHCLTTIGSISVINTTLPWASALAWSNSLGSGVCGLIDGSVAGDWRLPNRLELMSLQDRQNFNPTLPAGHPFYGVQSSLFGVSMYWTSSTYESSIFQGGAWDVSMTYGSDDFVGKDGKVYNHYVWPVRGGHLGDSVATVLPTSRDFGAVVVGGNADQVVTISNGGAASRMQVNAMVLSGADAAQFVVKAGDGTAGTCGSLTPIIPPGAACTVIVRYSPTSVGAKSAALRISASDTATPNTDLSFSGSAFINGVCGASGGSSFIAAPSASLCAAGISTAVAGSGPWSWACKGSNGGTDTNCMADVKSYSVAFTAGANGALSGVPSQTINYGGSSVAVTAVPDPHYHFVNWTGSLTSASNPLTIASVTSAVSFTANFAIDTFAVNFLAGGNGTISGSAAQTVKYGANATAVTAVPATGYHFVNWTEDGVEVGVNATLNISSVTAAHNYTANFAINSYALTYAAGANGSLTGITSQTVTYGGSATAVTAVADAGYHFFNWTDGVTVIGANPVLTASKVAAAHNYTANFAINTLAVIFASGGNGTISGTASQAIVSGANATSVTAVPATGYHFVNWTEGGTQVSATPALEITSVTAAHTYTANFASNIFAVTYASGGNGTLSGNTSQSVNYLGTAANVTAVPAADYHFVNWTEGTAVVETSPILAVSSIAADRSFTANFAINNFALSFASGANGTVIGNSNQTVNLGADATLVTAVPVTGYAFVNWTEGTDVAGVNAVLAITNVRAAHSYTANFAIKNFAIDFVSGGNGTISGSVSQSVAYHGNGTTVTAVPAENYHFVNWTEGAVLVGTTAALTVKNVSAAHSYTANFAVNTYAVTFTSDSNGTIKDNTSQTVSYGADAATVTAVPATGYHFVNWTESGSIVGTSAELTVKNITAAHSYMANFTAGPINGVCGTSNGGRFASAPAANLCSSGTASAITGTGPWSWSCSSANGGTDASCSASSLSYSVIPSVGEGISIVPSTPQTVSHGGTAKFTVTPAVGYGLLVTGCGGTLSGNSYTTGAITGGCTVTVAAVARNASGTGSAQPSINDALKALNAYVRKVELTAEEKIRYDVAPLGATGVPAGNGAVDSADVILILRRSVGLGNW
jgi:hypothetical protein